MTQHFKLEIVRSKYLKPNRQHFKLEIVRSKYLKPRSKILFFKLFVAMNGKCSL